MNPPHAILHAFPPSRTDLFDATRQLIDDGMLREIAEADCGFDADENYEELQRIRDEGIVPHRLQWNPREALELVRWSDPEDAKSYPGSACLHAHQMRAFACATLLLTEMVDGSDDSTMAQCLASTSALGEAVSQAAARFLTWMLPQHESDDRWLFAFGLLALATRLRAGRFREQDLGEAASWVLAEEAELRRELRSFGLREHAPAPFSMTHGLWKPLAADLVQNARGIEDATVRENLELLGSSILDI